MYRLPLDRFVPDAHPTASNGERTEKQVFPTLDPVRGLKPPEGGRGCDAGTRRLRAGDVLFPVSFPLQEPQFALYPICEHDALQGECRNVRGDYWFLDYQGKPPHR